MCIRFDGPSVLVCALMTIWTALRHNIVYQFGRHSKQNSAFLLIFSRLSFNTFLNTNLTITGNKNDRNDGICNGHPWIEHSDEQGEVYRVKKVRRSVKDI